MYFYTIKTRELNSYSPMSLVHLVSRIQRDYIHFETLDLMIIITFKSVLK